MLKNNGQETKESGAMLALTIVLTNFLLLTVIGGVFWLAKFMLTESNQLNQITRGFNLL